MKRIFPALAISLSTLGYAQENKDFDKVYVKTYLETSKNNFSEALKTADSLYENSSDPILKTRSLMLSASLYQQKGNYKNAVDYALAAEKIVLKTNNLSWKTRIYGFLASQYRILKLYDLSKKYTDYCIESSVKIEDSIAARQIKGLMLQEKAYFELDRKDYNASIKCIRSSQKLLHWTKKDHDFYSVNNEQLLGLNYYYLEQYQNALSHYNKGLLQAKSFPETYLTGLIHNGIANIYIKLNKATEAEEELSKAKRIAEETQYLQLKEEIYETAQKIYMLKNEVSKIKEYKEKKDSVEAQLDIETKNLFNHLLSKEIKKNSQTKKFTVANNIVLIIVMAAMIFSCIYFFYYKKAEDRTNKRFKAIIAELNRRAGEKKSMQTHHENKMMFGANNDLKGESDLNQLDKPSNNESPYLINKSNLEDINLMTAFTEEKLLKKLEDFEGTDLYLRNDMSLPSLASFCKTNTKYLSRIINSRKGMDFNNYINTLRINFIIEKLNNDPEYRKYKIAALADESGFSSQNKFATVFKKITSISPSVFIKYLQDQQQDPYEESQS